MRQNEIAEIVGQVTDLVREHYIFPEVSDAIAGLFDAKLADGGYDGLSDEAALAAAVTVDLQSVNGDKHLRLIHHIDPISEQRGDDESDLAEMAAWAEVTAHGVARAERLPGNIGYLDIQPILFPRLFPRRRSRPR